MARNEKELLQLFDFSEYKGKQLMVGMSGGVDSSVVAVALKKSGHQVIGVFMKNWEGDPCPSEAHYQDALKVCEKFSIPLYSVNFADEYHHKVFNEFKQDLMKGLTPNPDILCNQKIKFADFFHYCQQLGGDFVVTGHYANITPNGELFQAIDDSKDQSYFLSQVPANTFEKVLMPLGQIYKREVRYLAKLYDLPVAQKKDSMGICFIENEKFRHFMSDYIPSEPGFFVDETGAVQGQHMGIPFYTLGQRKGLGLGGAGKPWYVAKKNNQTREILVVRGSDHPFLWQQTLTLEGDFSKDYLRLLQFQVGKGLTLAIRHRGVKVEVKQCTPLTDYTLQITGEVPWFAPAPGQYGVFYCGGRCLGGAVIVDSVS